MNTYILIMTILFSGYGRGGVSVESIEVEGKSNCSKIGAEWILEMEYHYSSARPTFLCIKKEQNQ